MSSRLYDNTTGKGTRYKSAKLTEREVIVIRRLAMLGISQYKIAVIFGVSQSLISLVSRSIHWKHIAQSGA